MLRGVKRKSDALQLVSSHLITTCATLAAIILFVVIGTRVLPGFFADHGQAPSSGLAAALVLNIAIILFGWRRARDLETARAAVREAAEDAHRHAYLDCTTGLANRRSLVDALETELRGGDEPGLLALADLDFFKKVNDLHGHAAGDRLLVVAGQALTRAAPRGTLVARLGGDEFALLMPAMSDPATDSLVVDLLAELDLPVTIDSSHVQLSASIGLARIDRALSAEDNLRRADIAMYAAKRAGRGRLAWFDLAMEDELKARAALEDDIRRGIAAEEFVPFYQPLIALATGETTGFEVLARWNSPQRGLVEPVDFIPLCESSGLIAPLSMNVMRKALLEAKDWPPELKLAVNVSPVQFRDPQLAEKMLKLLVETGFPAQRLELEITEGSLIENPEQAVTLVQSLKNYGISIALDDFGTGYASLTQLQALPFDRIKIDKSFVASIADNPQSAAIVKTIASLGKLLCVPITAEGVESETVRKALAEVGCEDAQGWLFGRAVSASLVRGYFGLGKTAASAARPAGAAPRRASGGRKW